MAHELEQAHNTPNVPDPEPLKGLTVIILVCVLVVVLLAVVVGLPVLAGIVALFQTRH